MIEFEDIKSEWMILKAHLGVCLITIPREQPGFVEQYTYARDAKRRADIMSWFLLTQVHPDLRFFDARRRGRYDLRAHFVLELVQSVDRLSPNSYSEAITHTDHYAKQFTLALTEETKNEEVRLVLEVILKPRDGWSHLDGSFLPLRLYPVIHAQ